MIRVVPCIFHFNDKILRLTVECVNLTEFRIVETSLRKVLFRYANLNLNRITCDLPSFKIIEEMPVSHRVIVEKANVKRIVVDIDNIHEWICGRMVAHG